MIDNDKLMYKAINYFKGNLAFQKFKCVCPTCYKMNAIANASDVEKSHDILNGLKIKTFLCRPCEELAKPKKRAPRKKKELKD